MKQPQLKITMTAILAVIFITLGHSAVTIQPDNANILYEGRFDFSNPLQARFNWSGSSISILFEGTSVGILLEDGRADYDIIIDGAPHSVLVSVFGTSQYQLAQGLSDGPHHLKFAQRSEEHYAGAVFRGFVLDDGKAILAPPPPPSRKIEFIGDSYTVGYGNENTSGACSWGDIRPRTNTNISFGALTAADLGAQGMYLGWSGKGVVRNYSDSLQASAEPYPLFYGNTLGAIGPEWDFSLWIPQLVVICLGTNDFSTQPYPNEQVFIQVYRDFIARVAGNYPDALFLCVATPTGPLPGYVQAVVGQEQSGANAGKIFYAEFPDALTMSGCDWHPSANDDRLIADALVSVIQELPGWSSSAVSPYSQRLPANTILSTSRNPSALFDIMGRRIAFQGVSGMDFFPVISK